MERRDFLGEPVQHVRVAGKLSVDELIQQFKNSCSFGAGRLSDACDIYERMVRDDSCTIFLGVAGAVVPAGMRSLIADLIRERLVDVVVSTGANMVHDTIEALGGHHYKGHWLVDDSTLYKYHIYRIYDVFVPEEDFIKLDYKASSIFDEIASENVGKSLSSDEFAYELGKRLHDPNSILRAAYETNVPVFLPAVRDSEFGFVHWLHESRKNVQHRLMLDAFKDVPRIVGLCNRSAKNGMVIIGGGVPRNTIQSAALASKKGMDYAVIITMDRPEPGGLSGSTLEETVSWGKVKSRADKVMVFSDATIVFPIMVASVIERLSADFKRVANGGHEKLAVEESE
ncbi:MAG TPA: deoxyhypusine synthase [Candidatus Acidoferrum sp.]|nr:deoxyhypusine synthase [Candidatus Acidoferrum sp.]